MPKKIFIGGLSATATEASLQQMLSPFGAVLAVQLVADEPPATSSEVRGFAQTQRAEVTFADDVAAAKAVEELHGGLVDGAILSVTTPD